MAKKVASLFAEIGVKTDKLKRGLDDSKKQITGIGKEFKNLGGLAQTALVGGVAGSAIVAAKELYELGKRGAAVEQTGESFEFLLNKVDAAPDLLERLRQASRGTVDDMTLMSSTMTLAAGASDDLAKELIANTPRLLEMAKASNKLNPSLGDTAFLYESIATGIKRASPLILDNLGLTVKVGEANETFAKSIGKTAEELTAEEKQMALLNATLKAGDQLIAQVGGTVDAAGDDIARMEIQVKNLKDELSKAFAPAVSKVTGSLTELIQKEMDFYDVIEQIDKAEKSQQITRDTSLRIQEMFIRGIIDEEEAIARLSDKTEEWRVRMGLTDDQLVELTGHERAYIEGAKGAAEAISNLADETEILKEQEALLKQELSNLNTWMSGQVGSELESFKGKQEDLRNEYNLLEQAVSDLRNDDVVDSEQLEQFDELKTKIGEVRAEMQLNIKEHEKAQKSIVFDLLAQQAAYDGTTKEELAALTSVAEGWDLIDKETKRVSDEISIALEQLATDQNLAAFEERLDEVVSGIGTTADTTVEESLVPLAKAVETVEGIHDVIINVKVQGEVDALGALSKYTGAGITVPAGARQSGGPVGMNMPYMVGERGPELFVPNTSGNIVPNNQLMGGDTIIIHNHSAGAAALTNAMVDDRQAARLNASMGR